MKPTEYKDLEIWFVTGSQHLYGAETLRQVAEHSEKMAAGLNAAEQMPFRVVFKPILTTPEEIRGLCREANGNERCIGLVLWMHTFSPAKMWIAGLKSLSKPFLHLHTQFNRALPYASIDMDFMNLNQAAHGDREFGFITARMNLARKVVVGYWEDADTIAEIAAWSRAAAGWHESQHLKVARFGDNMREVAVTEGNKVSAEMQFGYSVNGYGVGDLVERMRAFSDAEVARLVEEYRSCYVIVGSDDRPDSLIAAARIELGLKAFLTEGGFGAFTDTFQDLHGMEQLPGIAVQRLMAAGFGFAGEGDWKTAALVRTMKVMAHGLAGGNIVHGGLHVRLCRHAQGAGIAHAGDLPVDRSGQARTAGPTAWHRRQGRPGATGVRYAAGTGCGGDCGGYGRPVPDDRERSGCGAAGGSAAEAARGARDVVTQAQPEGLRQRHGSMPAARIIPGSARRSTQSTWKISPKSPV